VVSLETILGIPHFCPKLPNRRPSRLIVLPAAFVIGGVGYAIESKYIELQEFV
jgi:hypothetical protein